MDTDQTVRGSILGYVVVLLGVAGWVAGSFLPVYRFGEDHSNGYRLYEPILGSLPLLHRIGQVMYLYGVVVAILMICVVGIRSRSARRWVEGALVGSVLVWTLVSSSLFLTIASNGLTPDFAIGIGFWCLLASVVVMVAGTVTVVASTCRADRRVVASDPDANSDRSG